MANVYDFAETIISNNVSKADSALASARQWLQKLAATQGELPATIVNAEIVADPGINWTKSITPVAAPTEPSYVAMLPSAIPAIQAVDAPTITPGAAPTYAVDLTGKPSALPTEAMGAVAALGTLPEDAMSAIPVLGATPATALTTVAVLGTIPASVVSTIAAMDTLPAVTAVPPAINVDALTTEFTWTNPTYTAVLSADIEAGIAQVLGGGTILSATYWTDQLARVEGAIARKQAGALRRARDGGAASKWPMPGLAVFAATAAVQEEGSRQLATARMEMAKQEADARREDFWKSMSEGIAWERALREFHHQVATRTLSAAEQLYLSRVSVHNAGVTRFNAMVEAARATLAVDDLSINRVLKKHAAGLSANEVELRQDAQAIERVIKPHASALAANDMEVKFDAQGLERLLKPFIAELSGSEAEVRLDAQRIKRVFDKHAAELAANGVEINQDGELVRRYQAEWAGYQTDKQAQIADATEQLKLWSGMVDANAKYKALDQAKSGLDIGAYTAVLGSIDAVSKASATVMNARTAGASYDLDGQKAVFDTDAKMQQAKLDSARILVAAKEASVKIDVAQAEFASSQGAAILKGVVDASTNMAASYISASGVNLSASVSDGYSHSMSNSVNQENVQGTTW